MHNEQHQQKILVVDDEPGIRNGLKKSLESLGYQVETADSGEQAIKQLRANSDINFLLSDYRMPGMTGFEVLKEVKKSAPTTKVVIMTGYGSIHHAVEAMHLGADDYLSKPFKIEDLEKVLAKNCPRNFEVSTAAIYTQDQNFISVLRKAERAAKSMAPILIEGSSGTGKELMARQIHEWSHRSQGPWVAINCAALPPGLLESELFGFEKGAFTGATDRKQGRFEQASGGTLLLDEIGELDPMLQAKLLRVLQEGEVDRVGGRKPTKVDVRIIATTNKNLEQLVQEGKFREDLFFRLYGVRFTLPPLRQRRGDIGLLAEEFLKRQSNALNQSLRFAPGVIAVLEQRPWFGNIRELERAVERAAVLSDEGTVKIEHFEFEDAVRTSAISNVNTYGETDAANRSIKQMEKDIILDALRVHAGNRTHTAKALGMSLRTLRHKIKQYRELGEQVASYEPGTSGHKLPMISLPTALHDAELSALGELSNVGHQIA